MLVTDAVSDISHRQYVSYDRFQSEVICQLSIMGTISVIGRSDVQSWVLSQLLIRGNISDVNQGNVAGVNHR